MQRGVHDVLPTATHDEASRESFVVALKSHVATEVTGGNRLFFDTVAAPEFKRRHGYAPRNRSDVRRAMNPVPYYQMSSSLKRTTQELMWDYVGSSVERQLPALLDRAKQVTASPKGSLHLDADLPLPRYLTAVDIHCMPGNYTTDLVDGDVFAGALYDRSVYLFAMGGLGAYNDDVGRTLITALKEKFPRFHPRRILDLGCAVGHSTLPYCDAFPGSEVHAVELGAPMLRYAHARAEALGKHVHFSQQNAERTNYPDGHFDLIVSHILFHETSSKAVPRILKECHRLLAPGGITLHCEGPPWNRMSPYEASILDWDTHYNAEPYIGQVHDEDPKHLMTAAGFSPSQYLDLSVPSVTMSRYFPQLFSEGNNGIDGTWWYFGASK
ncbi:MAG: class I SAM-dependent methyltransferase [Alphaproteobacteria bacterium]|nr:class I SAM-dependent methyltransferase [Alphaproteobacteria bacterium]